MNAPAQSDPKLAQVRELALDAFQVELSPADLERAARLLSDGLRPVEVAAKLLGGRRA